jgi:hypothetical protein
MASTTGARMIAAGGGVVHAEAADPFTGEAARRPVCRPGSASGLGLTGRRASAWRYTAKDMTCTRCAAKLAS